MRKLSAALGFTSVFALASLAQATPTGEPLCITYLEPEKNLTHCEYRKPHVLEIKTDAGIARMSGSVDMKKPEPIEGQDRNQCEAFLKEKQKAHGYCSMRLDWNM